MWFNEAPHNLLRDQFKIPGILLLYVQCICGIIFCALHLETRLPMMSIINCVFTFQTGNEKKKCHCGAKNCSSFLGVRPKNQIQEEKSKKVDKRKKKKIKKAVIKEGLFFCVCVN